MNIRFTVFGYEVARIDLDMGEAAPVAVTPVDSAVGIVSDWWIHRLFKAQR